MYRPAFVGGSGAKLTSEIHSDDMPLDITRHVDIIEIMENYISRVRPQPEIRPELDLAYEIEGQSVILQEVRPAFNDPTKILKSGYAKTTYVKSKNVWKVFWLRADLKWHSYEPTPTVKKLSDFLELVDEDKYGCFNG